MDVHVVPDVGDCMTPAPHSVAPSDTLAHARRLMDEHGIRHLPVLRGGDLVGVLSARDLGLALARAPAPPAAVEDVMNPDPYSVPPSTPLTLVARTMAERKIGSAIVFERGVVIGVFTTTDALHALTDTLEGKNARRTYETVTTAPPAGRRGTERDVP